jgi:hypothetical protein
MIRKIVLAIMFLTIITACSDTGLPKHDISDFSFLKKGMSYQQIVDKVGEPDEEVGSGAYIYIYYLSDGRSVALSFIQLSSLYSARLIKENGDVERILVSP